MPSEDYTSTPSTGKLKLKGVKDSKIAKKGKKNKSSGKSDVKPADARDKDNSVMLSKLEDEDREIEKEQGRRRSKHEELIIGDGEVEEGGGECEDSGARHKTEAEKRYDEQRRKRVGLLHVHLILLSRVCTNQFGLD